IAATVFNFTFHHIFTYRHVDRRNDNTWYAQIADHTGFEQIPASYRRAMPGIEIVETPITFMGRLIPIGGNPTPTPWLQTVPKQRTSNLAVMESYYVDDKKMSYTIGNNNPQERFGIIRVQAGKEPGRVFEMHNKTSSIGRLGENNIFLED